MNSRLQDSLPLNSKAQVHLAKPWETSLDREDSGGNVEEFVAVLGQHHAAILGYVIALVAKPADAEDIMQETCIALWRKFSEYDANRGFRPWAKKIAFIEVLRYRQQTSRSRLWFNESVLEMLSQDLIEPKEETDLRLGALAECMGRISESDRHVIQSRYHRGQSVRDISLVLDRPESTVYKRLQKIRSALADCIRSRMALESQPNG